MEIKKGVLTVTTFSALLALQGCAMWDDMTGEDETAQAEQPADQQMAEAEDEGTFEDEEVAAAEDEGIFEDEEDEIAMADEDELSQDEAQFDPGQGQQQASAMPPGVPAPVDASMVRELQQALNQQGHDLQTDGIWGPETHQALTEYQNQQGIQGNGQINLATAEQLGLTQQGQQTAQAGQQGQSDQQSQQDQQMAQADQQAQSDQQQSQPQQQSQQPQQQAQSSQQSQPGQQQDQAGQQQAQQSYSQEELTQAQLDAIRNPQPQDQQAQSGQQSQQQDQQTAQADQQQSGQQGQQSQQQTAQADQGQQAAEIAVSEALVRELQRELQNQGYEVEVDGAWGPGTEQALTNYQEDNNLEATGRLNVATAEQLGLVQEPSQ